MKKKSRRLSLHGQIIKSSYNELEQLETRTNIRPKSPNIQVIDSSFKPTQIKRTSF